VGPASDSKAREDVTRKVAAYIGRAREEMDRFVELAHREMIARE